MEKQTNESSWSIVAKGSGAMEGGEDLYAALREHGVAVAPPVQEGEGDARLGTPEILLTIVVTAAAKAVVSTGLTYLEQYLLRQVELPTGERRLQVVVKTDSGGVKRFPLGLRAASADVIKAFIGNVRAHVEKLL